MILTIYTSAKLECVEINDFDIQLASWTLSTNTCSQLFTVENHLIQNTSRLLARYYYNTETLCQYVFGLPVSNLDKE